MPTAALGSAEPGSARRPPSWASFSVLVASPRRSGFSMCAHPRCRGGSLPTDASDRPACRLASASRPFRRRHVRVPPGSSNYVQVSGVSTMPAWSKRLDLGMALSPTSGVSERFRVPAPARLASWLCTGAAGVPRLAGVFQLHAVDAGRHDLALCDKYHGSLRFQAIHCRDREGFIRGGAGRWRIGKSAVAAVGAVVSRWVATGDRAPRTMARCHARHSDGARIGRHRGS